jgi:rhodanese-related sulfurtransferase/DNA-binding transcriptional ArsR family regulator
LITKRSRSRQNVNQRDHRAFKARLYREFARIGSALASEKRLELLDLLAQAPRNVEALAAETAMSVANTSQHLQVLRGARLVDSERDGTKITYSLAGDDVLRLWLQLRAVGETRLAEVDQVARDFGVPGVGESLSAGDLGDLLKGDSAYLVDVRPAIEYASGHIPGAVSLPIDELPTRIGELPVDRHIVAYCRGAFCLFADEAVAYLRRHGYTASRLEGGWPEWRAEQSLAIPQERRGP